MLFWLAAILSLRKILRMIAYPILRHRLRLSYEAEAENLTTDDIITRILDTLPVP